MASSAALVAPINGVPVEIDPRCSTCEQTKSGDWINWQKCWSTPYRGIAGEPRILAHTSPCPCFEDPIMLRLQSPSVIGNNSSWWFFVCNRCRLRLRLKRLCIERMKVEDRRVIIPLMGPGPHETKPQLWPHLSGQNWARNSEIDGPLGIGDYWSSPSFPGSSLGTDPWQDCLEDQDISD